MSAEARRLARAHWAGRLTKLVEEPELDPDVLAMTPHDRVAMVWQLTMDSWAVTGRPVPSYQRATMPGRMVRGGR